MKYKKRYKINIYLDIIRVYKYNRIKKVQIMKKVVTILFAFVLLIGSCVFFACSNDEYITVCKVVYTTNGETKTSASTYFIDYSAPTQITADEYNASPQAYRISSTGSPHQVSPSFEIPKEAEGQITYSTRNNNPNKEWWYLCAYNYMTGGWLYNKFTVIGVDYYFVQVKIIDNSTIAIKDRNGETVYTVTSYSITYFE